MIPSRFNDMAASLELPPKMLDSAVKRYLLPFATIALVLSLQTFLQVVLPKRQRLSIRILPSPRHFCSCLVRWIRPGSHLLFAHHGCNPGRNSSWISPGHD